MDIQQVMTLERDLVVPLRGYTGDVNPGNGWRDNESGWREFGGNNGNT